MMFEAERLMTFPKSTIGTAMMTMSTVMKMLSVMTMLVVMAVARNVRAYFQVHPSIDEWCS